MGILATVLLLAAVLVWLIRAPRRGRGDPDRADPMVLDQAELEEAEREVRDQETGLRPEDGFEGDDWGPGTARPTRRR